MTHMGTVAITGANGFIGSIVGRRLVEQGWRVLALVRRPLDFSVTESRAFSLGDALEPGLLEGVDRLVHCAWDLTATRESEIHRVNILGTARLVAAAQAAGSRSVVFISSMSAYPGTSQRYGRSKLAAERLVTGVGGTSVRLGLVYGEPWGGMAGALRRATALPVLPVPAAKSHQFLVHVDDVAAGVAKLVAGPHPIPSVIGLAHPEQVEFRRFLIRLSAAEGRRPRLVHVPWRPLYALMRTAELSRVSLPLRADSLRGLAQPASSVPAVEAWTSLGIRLRSLSEAMPASSTGDPDRS